MLFQSFGEREFLCVQSPVTITKICSEAEMGEALRDHLTETHQINYVVLVKKSKENLLLLGWISEILCRCKVIETYSDINIYNNKTSKRCLYIFEISFTKCRIRSKLKVVNL